MKEVLLVGNPNSGKTTLFNALTKSNEHIGNWHGVTVENKEKTFKVDCQEFLLVDTPGIYSLCPLSFEEEVAVATILAGEGKRVLNIVDQNNLQRNLYLTLCLLERGCDVVLVINETCKKPIYQIDCGALEKLLGVDVVVVNPEKKVGIDKLKKILLQEKKATRKLPYLKELNRGGINLFSKEENKDFLLVKLYERDEKYFKKLGFSDFKTIFADIPQNSVQHLAQVRYDFIDKILQETTKKADRTFGKSKLDKIFLNKWVAFPVFFLVLFAVFYLTFFSLGAWLSDGLGVLLETISSPILAVLKNSFGNSWFYELFNVAIFGGVATVLSFLPQVVLLFFFLSILEDSGYMSRIAFIFEDILGKIGLSGKSVYTLLMGFGCSTTAIMTARNMEDINAKIKTALLCPYMSCSAKIPIYTVIGGAFFGAKNIFVIMGLYLLGVVISIAVSKILDATILKSNKQSFILEFPPYRTTNLKRVLKILWKNVKIFIVKVGSIMVAMNVIVWVLSNFTFKFSFVPDNGGVSMLEWVGKLFAPLFVPLGFGNWAIVCALLAGLVAKEVVVSTIAMFNGIDAGASKLVSQSILIPTSLVFFPSNASVLSFLVFCLLYTPCIASISMLAQEIGKKWTFVGVVVQLFVAYVVAFVVYNVVFACEVFGTWKVVLSILSAVSLLLAIFAVVKKFSNKCKCAHCFDCENCCKNRKKR
ncbi:MAG: ferrous iron transport protein B [Clostridia bacterium]|nr:ferrous iron transport protein B [Clostridia bacterium]